MSELPDEAINPNSIKILVIDDEMVSRTVVKKLLEKAGYVNVVVLASAREAIERIKGDHFHLIITDVKMPEMNGIEFLESLQKDEKTVNLPVIMMSAIDELPLVYRCLQMGACDFLTKPIKQGMIQNLWQNVWRKRKERNLLQLYQNAKGDGARTEEQLKAKLQQLHEQVNEAVSTPIKAINDTLSKLITDGSLNHKVRETLGDILKTLKDSHVYKGAVESFIQEKNSSEQLDSETRKWLETEFALPPRLRSTHSYSGNLFKITQIPDDDAYLMALMSNWEFDVWSVPNDSTLLKMITVMFNSFGLLERFRIDPDDFQKFIVATQALYSEKNPYHNFRHAFDVTHMAYLLLTKANGIDFLTPIEVLTVMICGLLHDVDHPGLTNNFQIHTRSDLAIIYNDQSVLENHSCSTGYRLLIKHKILNNLTADESGRIRKLLIDIILSTDLAKHITALTEFQTFMESNNSKIDRDNDEHRAIISKFILKSADLSNPAKPFRIAKYWAEIIQEEFFIQGEQEQNLGIPISPFMERGKSSLPQMQVNFLTFIVIPHFQAVAKILPITEQKVLPVLLDNRETWKGILSEKPL